MISLLELTNYLNSLLDHANIKDESLNGLQFPGNKTVKKIAIAVDACLHTITKAIEENCDFLFVHHGLFWSFQGANRVDENLKNYYKILIDGNLSLFASHLPLDLHSKYGNNSGLISLLGGELKDSFCPYHGVEIGYYSDSFENWSLGKLLNELVQKLSLSKISLLPKGSMELEDITFNKTHGSVSSSNSMDELLQEYTTPVLGVGIVSGGGSDGLEDLQKNKIDTFITGEVPHYSIIKAREDNVNLIVAGHYKTETVGIKLIAKHLMEKFNLESVFIDIPTGV